MTAHRFVGRTGWAPLLAVVIVLFAAATLVGLFRLWKPVPPPSLVIGVNDKTNRAALGGRYQQSFIERNWDLSYFSLRTLTHMTD